jgi:hypothetical protein
MVSTIAVPKENENDKYCLTFVFKASETILEWICSCQSREAS